MGRCHLGRPIDSLGLNGERDNKARRRGRLRDGLEKESSARAGVAMVMRGEWTDPRLGRVSIVIDAATIHDCSRPTVYPELTLRSRLWLDSISATLHTCQVFAGASANGSAFVAPATIRWQLAHTALAHRVLGWDPASPSRPAEVQECRRGNGWVDSFFFPIDLEILNYLVCIRATAIKRAEDFCSIVGMTLIICE